MVVLAGSHTEYVQWCHAQGYDPYDEFFTVGTWYERHNLDGITRSLINRTEGGEPVGWAWVRQHWAAMKARDRFKRTGM